MARVWPEHNAVGAGRLLQGPERGLRTGVPQVGHSLPFDEIALARQELHEALDDTREQDLELFRGRGAHGVEYRQALGGAIDPIGVGRESWS